MMDAKQEADLRVAYVRGKESAEAFSWLRGSDPLRTELIALNDTLGQLVTQHQLVPPFGSVSRKFSRR